MKVLDLMTGLKVSSGDPAVHLAMFISTLYMPKNQSCGEQNYGQTILLLCISHGVNAFRFLVRQITENIIIATPQYTVTAEFIDRAYRLICSSLHIWAIMTA